MADNKKENWISKKEMLFIAVATLWIIFPDPIPFIDDFFLAIINVLIMMGKLNF